MESAEAVMSSCGTRAVKVANYLRTAAPESIDRSQIEAYVEQLSVAETVDAVEPHDDGLRAWLAQNPMPLPAQLVAGPLFHGTLVFVRMTFHHPSGATSAIALSDIEVAAQYAALAVNPISRYASLYGPNSVNVSPNVIEFDAQLSGDSFTMSDFVGWVDQCAQLARNSGVSTPCIVVLHNRDLPNSAQFLNNRNSFHSMTAAQNAFCYCLVFGEGLNVADNNHTFNNQPNQKVYAHTLSHEIAETVVDPRVDGRNPEVCDACAGNCNNEWFCLFDEDGTFLGGTNDTATATGYSYFINSIVSPAAALDSNECIIDPATRQSSCVYAPPDADSTDLVLTDFAGQNWLITPAGYAVGEQPATFDGQRWLLVLSGVVLVGLKGQTSGDWLRETIRFMPDVLSPLNYAISRYGIPVPTSTVPGVSFIPQFQAEQWAPFASPSSMYDAHESIDAGYAVDVWRPAPFGKITNGTSTIGNIFTGIRVDVAVRDSDAYLYRVAYNITLEGRIVFESTYLG